METWILILLLIFFGLFEFLAAFIFNIKIKMINRKQYNPAAILGSIATVLFMLMTLVTPLVADQTSFWFIFAGAGMMALGNFLASLALIPFENWVKKREAKKEVK